MGTETKAVLAGAALAVMLIGGKTVVSGVKVGAVKTSHAVVRIFRHPVHSAKNGAIHEPK
jgi:hypothetical protein